MNINDWNKVIIIILLLLLLDADGVHLTPVAGDRFMAHIEAALTALNDDIHYDGNEVQPTASASPQPQDCLQQILEAVNWNSGKLKMIGAIGDTVFYLTQTILKLLDIWCEDNTQQIWQYCLLVGKRTQY